MTFYVTFRSPRFNKFCKSCNFLLASHYLKRAIVMYYVAEILSNDVVRRIYGFFVAVFGMTAFLLLAA